MFQLFSKKPQTPLEIVAARHTKLMTLHPNMYFELAETRRSGCCAWLTSEDIGDNSNRTVISIAGGSSLVDTIANLAKNSNVELSEMTQLNTLFSALYDSHNYACFLLYAKPKEGWVLNISTHHTVGHNQYELLVSVTTNNMHDTLTEGLHALLLRQ
jgi:hypothetical protein